MKTLQDLTPEIRSRIPEYISKVRDDLYSGKEHKTNKREDTIRYIEMIYDIVGQDKPVVVIADNPDQYKVFFELLRKDKRIALLWKLKNRKPTPTDINKELGSELNSELFSELHLELRSELGAEIRSELDLEIRSELDLELRSELGAEIRSELDLEIRSELGAEIRSELDLELRSELGAEIHSELYSELRSELDEELHSELFSELGSELGSELHSELHSELYSELYSELHSELYSELRSELDSELKTELDSELKTELYSELYSELDSELKTELRKEKERSHYLFLCNIYSRVYLTWYKFIQDEFQIEHSQKIVLDKLYELINKTFITRCFFTKGYVLVLHTPNRIIRNNVGFHCIDGPAICFKGNYGMYYINGRKINKQLITNGFRFDDFIKEENEDTKTAMLTIVKERDGQQGLMQFLNAEVIDEQVIDHDSGHAETVKLWKTKETYSFLQNRHGSINQPYCWTEMTCPSTGSVYLIENSADFTDVVESMKFLRPQFVPQDMEYNFTQFNN